MSGGDGRLLCRGTNTKLGTVKRGPDSSAGGETVQGSRRENVLESP